MEKAATARLEEHGQCEDVPGEADLAVDGLVGNALGTAVDGPSGNKPIAQVAPIRGTAVPNAAPARRQFLPNVERVLPHARHRFVVPTERFNLSIRDRACWCLIEGGKVSGFGAKKIEKPNHKQYLVVYRDTS